MTDSTAAPFRLVLVPLIAMLAAQAAGSFSQVTLPVLASEAGPDIGISASWIGLFSGLVYVAAATSSLLCSWTITRYGALRVCQVCVLLAAAGLALIPLGVVWLLPVAALLIGMGYGPLTPASSHVLARRSPPGIRSLVFSLKQTAVPIGHAVAGLLLPALVVLGGWRLSATVAALLCAVLVLALQPARRRLDDDRSADARPGLRSVLDPLLLVYRHPPLRNLALISAAFACGQSTFVTFLVPYLSGPIELPLVTAGLALSLATATAVAARIAWGALSDAWLDARGTLFLVSVIATAVNFLFALSSANWPIIALFILACAGGATLMSWNGVFLAEVARHAPPSAVGQATGAVSFVTFAGGAIAPPFVGVVVELTGSFAGAFATLGVLGIACSLICLRLPRASEG